MFEKIKKFYRERKNNAISGVTTKIANKALHREIPYIGTITDIEIDSLNKNVFFDLALNGEKDIIRLNIQGYKISEIDNQKFLCWNKIIVSRPWITLLIAKYAPKDNKMVVSDIIAWLVDLLI
jgi:hypothetical protein